MSGQFTDYIPVRMEPERGRGFHGEVQMGKKWMIILIVLTAGIVVAVGALGIGKNKKKTQMKKFKNL